MTENHLMKRVCPSCAKKVGIGWKYCASCGELVENTRPKPQLTTPMDKLYTVSQEEIQVSFKTPTSLKKFSDKLRETVSEPLDRGEEVADATITPFVFVVKRDGVAVKQLEEVKDSSGKQLFAKDYISYYYHNEEKQAFINNRVLKVGDKYRFKNGDALRIGEIIYIFTIMNQEDVHWNVEPITSDLAEQLLDILDIEAEDMIFAHPNDAGEILLNTEVLHRQTRLQNYDVLSIQYRLFMVYDDCLIFQDELTEGQLKTIADDVNKIDSQESLVVNIRERRADKKVLLSDIQFSVHPGEMVLILGGSGAGKTTLINAIMGSEKADATILLGDVDVYKQFGKVRRMIANVPQFSLHREKDSVYMTLRNAAEMKLPRDFVRDTKLLEKRIESVLKVVRLSKKRDALVSELSGGEKKRLSIATEYVAQPVVFVLDEPDSGVDGSSARAIMASLREIADEQKMVFVISHTPDRTPELFDKVLVLAKSEKESCGKLAFFGSVVDTLDFFDTPALELVVEKIEETPDTYIEKYHAYVAEREGE